MIKSIISSYRAWDEAGDYGDSQLYDAVLAIDTKKFKKGDTISVATFLYSKGICQLWNKEGAEIVEEFNIVLTPVFKS
jgi:hypothetical protein